MKLIVVPLDGSALAEQALPYVRLLAPIMGARIRLLHVVSDIDTHDPLAYDVTALYSMSDVVAAQQERQQRSWQATREHAEGYLDSQAMRLREEGFDVEIDVRFGSPAEMIVETAEHRGAALIAMATHGYSGLRRWAIGSVTDKVVHAASTPVFVVRGSAEVVPRELALKQILVPLDGSAFSRQALPFAAELATCSQADLTLLQAVSPTIEPNPGLRPLGRPILETESSLEALREQANRDLNSQAAALRKRDLVVATLAPTGHAAEVIVDEARRHGVDLIVMATHGRGGLRRWALGSVADKVLHAADTPLVLVRTQEPEE